LAWGRWKHLWEWTACSLLMPVWPVVCTRQCALSPTRLCTPFLLGLLGLPSAKHWRLPDRPSPFPTRACSTCAANTTAGAQAVAHPGPPQPWLSCSAVFLRPSPLQKPDSELWRALDLVHLRQAVADLAGGLDAPVVEGGANFSVGQKQLVGAAVGAVHGVLNACCCRSDWDGLRERRYLVPLLRHMHDLYAAGNLFRRTCLPVAGVQMVYHCVLKRTSTRPRKHCKLWHASPQPPQ